MNDKKELVRCAGCNKNFESYKYRKRKYCTQKCRFKYYEKITLVCANDKCKKEFNVHRCYSKSRKYCTEKCMYTDLVWISKQKAIRHSSDTRWKISKSVKESILGPRNPNYKSGLHTLRRIVRQKANGICQLCNYGHIGSIGFLDLHHKDTNRENNTEENLICICPNCHRELHLKEKGLIS